jgi:hypothetical protein
VLVTLEEAALLDSGLDCPPWMLRFFSLSRILRAALSVTTLLEVLKVPFSRLAGLCEGLTGVTLG